MRQVWTAAIAGLLVMSCVASAVDDAFPRESVSVADEQLTVWVADDSEERQDGLMGVSQFPAGVDGMLFIWPQPVSASFHMLDTPMPLDIWWFDSAGVLLGSAEMKPCAIDPCTSYRSPGPVLWVLETPSGRFDFQLGAALSTVGND